MTNIETRRQQIQSEIDRKKSLKERNILGQFSTPYELACQICDYLAPMLPAEIECFLEPAIGTGVFFSALSERFKIKHSIGFEIDKDYYNPTSELWQGFDIKLFNCDFFSAEPTEKASLILANPPYSRHHHISPETKAYLARRIKELYGIEVSGLSGLYLYFMILSTQWLKEGGISCWLVPSDFLSVNFGAALKRFLLEKVDLISIHSFKMEDVKFNDALVSSSIIVFKKSDGGLKSDAVRFSWGNSVENPSKVKVAKKITLSPELKWTEPVLCSDNSFFDSHCTIGNFFEVKRGISTGDNNFFIIGEDVAREFNISTNNLSIVIPSPRKINSNIFNPSSSSKDKLFLVCSNDTLTTIKSTNEGLYNYLIYGEEIGVNKKANCMNRSPWYKCEHRDAPPILVSYMGRDKEDGKSPVKFILNEAGAIATNSYLMLYPKRQYKYLFTDKAVRKQIWQVLSSIPNEVLKIYGRSYGGGLLKWEPNELKSIPCPTLGEIMKSDSPTLFEF